MVVLEDCAGVVDVAISLWAAVDSTDDTDDIML